MTLVSLVYWIKPIPIAWEEKIKVSTDDWHVSWSAIHCHDNLFSANRYGLMVEL